jgi:hypothetical protein
MPCALAGKLVIETRNVVLHVNHADYLPEQKLEFVQLPEALDILMTETLFDLPSPSSLCRTTCLAVRWDTRELKPGPAPKFAVRRNSFTGKTWSASALECGGEDRSSVHGSCVALRGRPVGSRCRHGTTRILWYGGIWRV